MWSWDAFPKCSLLVPDVSFVISDFAWLICIKNVKLTSKRSKFNCAFNLNILMSIQEVPVSESTGKFPKFSFHLIESVAVTQTRTCRFRWFPGRLCESVILHFFVIFALQCNSVILRSLHRHGDYWRPHRQSDSKYLGSYVIMLNNLS